MHSDQDYHNAMYDEVCTLSKLQITRILAAIAPLREHDQKQAIADAVKQAKPSWDRPPMWVTLDLRPAWQEGYTAARQDILRAGGVS